MKVHPETKIAVVVSQFNQEVTEKLWQSTKTRLLELGLKENDITMVPVPGAVEIPLMAQAMALTKRFAAVICLGAVIRGETDHYDYVCQQVSYGCQRVALQLHLPIIFGVLTTNTDEQALARASGKGQAVADAALTMIDALRPFQVTTTTLVDQIDACR
jgi:6,7-dimethyl-8-ribityllumazine synthase